MPRNLSIPEKQLDAFSLMSKNAKKLSLIQKVADNVDPSKLNAKRITKDFAELAEISSAEANKIVSQIMSFHYLKTVFEVGPDELFDDLTQALELKDTKAFSKDDLENWKDSRDSIKAVMSSSHPLSLLQKSMRLKYEHQNILSTASIITDVRPLFDDAASTIKQMSIGFMLEVRYHDGSDTESLFAALDINDIAKLKRACERAEAKAMVLERQLNSCDWPVIVTGADEDE